MEIQVEELGVLARKLTVVLPKDVVAKGLSEAYKKIQSEVTIKGFRRGKVPMDVLKRQFGEKVDADLAQKLVEESYFDALAQSKLDAVVHPEVKKHFFADDGTFHYEAEIDIRPTVQLGTYKGIEVEVPEVVVSEADVQAELERLRMQMAPLRNVEDRTVQEGDVVVINFTTFHNGEEMKQVGGKNFSIDVGSGTTSVELEKALIGLRKGEDAVREITFSENNKNPIIAGKTLEFHIAVLEVKERVLPQIDDEFAKDIGTSFAGLDALKAHIQEKLRREKEESRDGKIIDKIMQKLVADHDFDLPKRTVIYEAEMQVKEMENMLMKQGQTLESAGLNRDKLAQQFLDMAASRVKGDFIIKKIADVENIRLSDGDINKGFERVARQHNMPVEEAKKYFKAREYLMPFMSELLNEKVLAMLRREAVLKVVPAAAETVVE